MTDTSSYSSYFNSIDRQRSTPSVIKLLRLARQLRFQEDVDHWSALLESRGIDPKGI